MSDPWAEPVGSQGGWGAGVTQVRRRVCRVDAFHIPSWVLFRDRRFSFPPDAVPRTTPPRPLRGSALRRVSFARPNPSPGSPPQGTTPRRTSIRASMQNLAGDTENVPLSALAGMSGRAPNKRMTMGGPTMVPYRGGPGSPQGSPLANRSNYPGAPNSPPSAPPSHTYGEPANSGVRTRSMGPPAAVTRGHGAPPRGEVSDGGGDPWGQGTNWQLDSNAAKAQAQRRRQTSFVPGTGSTAQAPMTNQYGQYAQGRPRTGSTRTEDEFHNTQEEFHSVPSSPWGSPAKANGQALHKNSDNGVYNDGRGIGSPPSAPPPPGGSPMRAWPGAGATHGYGTPARLGDQGNARSGQAERERSVSAPVTRVGSPDKHGNPGQEGYGDEDGRREHGSYQRDDDAYRGNQPYPTHHQTRPRHNRVDSGSGEYPDARDASRVTPVAASKVKVTAPPMSPTHPVYAKQQQHASLKTNAKSQSLYAGPNALIGVPVMNQVALAGAAPDGCYLGGWRGDERARILAYEACLQACLEGSLGSNAPQHKVDMAVHFLADRCAELRRGFGMDGILVGSRGNAGTLLGGAKDKDGGKAQGASGRDKAGPGMDVGVGGQRWAGVTVDVTEVSITTRGWKRFTGGVDPRDVYAAAKERGARAAAAVATATPHARGDICRVRACADGDGKRHSSFAASPSSGGGGDSATLHVGCGDARIRLATGDDALAFEVDLGQGKIAFCKPSLEDVSRMAGEGRNIVELPLRYANGKEKGYLRFTAHLEPIGGYDWGAPLTTLDYGNQGESRGDVGGAGFGSAVEGNGWSAAGNGPLPPSAAYDVALNASLRALGFHRRRLALHGPWAWLLRELSELQGVSPNHTSLRYVRHVLAVATPTADCLALILDHLAPCLREHASGGLTATEMNALDGIRTAVEQLVGVCFQNYKNLSEDEPRGIAKALPETQPAPALAIAVELSRILQRDPTSPEALRQLQTHLQTAARACYRRHHSVFLGDRNRNENEVSDPSDPGHARLFAGLSQMCLGLCRELGVDHQIQDAEVLPGRTLLPQIAAGVYCVEASACVSKMLSSNPPPAPPGAEAIDLVDALCELQEAAVAADVSDEYDGAGKKPGGHHPPYPGANGSPAAVALDPKQIFAPHVASWIEAARETLLHACVSALGKHGVGGVAMEEAYGEARCALEGFERVVGRWPDAAVNLEEVLADADRLLLHRIGAAADETKQATSAGGLFRGYVPSGNNGHANENGNRDPRSTFTNANRAGFNRVSVASAFAANSRHPGTVRESVRFTGHTLRRAPAFGAGNGNGAHGNDTGICEERQIGSPSSKTTNSNAANGALHRLRAGKAAAASALLKAARGKFTDRGGGDRASEKRHGSPGTVEEGYVPPELAAALTALKAMEVLRPEVGQRLVTWVAAAGGGQRAAGDTFGRRSAEVLGELRAQYAGHLRRAVGLVTNAGPSLLEALRQSATRPAPSARPVRRPTGGAFGRGDGTAATSPMRSPRKECDGDDLVLSDAEDAEMNNGNDLEASAEAASRDELDLVVAPVLHHVECVVDGLLNAIPQRRALVGVLRGLWSNYGQQSLKFVEEDLRQRSSWRLRLMATGASDRVSVAISGAIRDALGHDVKEKDLEPPQSMKKLADFMSEGSAEESVSVY